MSLVWLLKGHQARPSNVVAFEQRKLNSKHADMNSISCAGSPVEALSVPGCAYRSTAWSARATQ